MEVRPGYKLTEVGVIPEDWDVLPFEQLAHIERGKFTARPRNDPKFYGGDIPFIQTGDVTNANGHITTYSQTLNHQGLKVSKLFPQGTLFFTIAANIGDVGFAAFDTACPDSLVAISPTKATDKTWLSYELAKRKSSFEGIATHNAQLNINLEKLRPYLLPHPPLPEQRAIAAALSDVDALLDGLERLIAKKRDLKQASMQQLLTGQTRLPGEWHVKTGYKKTEVGEIPEDWDVRTLGSITSLLTNGFVGIATTAYVDGEDGVIYIQGYNVETNGFNFRGIKRVSREFHLRHQKSCLQPGDLLTIQTGEIGVTAAVPPELAGANCHALVISRLHKTTSDPYYYSQFFNSERGRSDFKKIETGTTMKHLNCGDMKDLLLPSPPLTEQSAIATILSDMDAEIAALEARRDKTRALKQGMMQELLTGKTRLL